MSGNRSKKQDSGLPNPNGKGSSSEGSNVKPPDLGAPDLSKQDDKSSEKKPSLGIKVVALRKGWFGNVRRMPGDEFTVATKKQLGAWMQCQDEKHRADHEAEMRKKKEKIKEQRARIMSADR